MIVKGSAVKVHYIGKLSDGEVFDSSEGREPLEFIFGEEMVIPGFEKAILGKEVGYKANIVIAIDDAYGPIRDDLFIEIPIDKLPGDVEIGQVLQADSGDGKQVQVIVKEINENHVIIDGNHPLSGKELIFDIEIIEVI